MAEATVNDQNQHYVPKMLLKHFSVPLKHDQIIAFDKQTERSFPVNISKVSSEKAFYDVEVGDLVYSMEASLKNIEDTTAGVIRSIIETEQLPKPDSVERCLLAIFVAVQFLRVRSVRINVNRMNELLKEKLESIGAKPSDIEHLTSMGKDAPKVVSMRLLEKISDFVPFFYFKMWMLFKSAKENPFFVSDNPVTLQNKKDFGPFHGNLGLGVEGIEIYMPVSNHLSLGILCTSYEEEMNEAHQQLSALRQNRPDVVAARLGERGKWFDAFMEGVRTGTAVPIPPKVVLNLNSLQAYFSSRFIYCAHDRFDLIREMIKDNPAIKVGGLQYSLV